MELHRFFEGIRMMPEAVRQVGRLHIEERTYQRIKALFQRDKKKFYTTVLRQPDFRICFLYYFSRMGCETYERYQEDGIGERIYWDTFYDLTLWCENCFREYGAYGIDQYDWFFRHIECRLFRLGRLEFERMESEWALKYGRTEIFPREKGWSWQPLELPVNRLSVFGESSILTYAIHGCCILSFLGCWERKAISWAFRSYFGSSRWILPREKQNGGSLGKYRMTWSCTRKQPASRKRQRSI